MNIIDAVMIIIILVGFLIGFKRGAIKTAVILVGTIIVVVGAFYLKNPIAVFCYKTFPFIDFSGILNGASIVNILFYEAISFLIAASILGILLKIVVKITGLIEGILNATIIFGFVSKLIGGVLGAIEMYVIIFIVLFFCKQPFINVSGVDDSKYADYILENTPILTDAVKGTISTINDIYLMRDNYSFKNDEFEYNSMIKLLEYKVIEVDSLKVLKDKNKIKFDGINELINEYERKENDKVKQ